MRRNDPDSICKGFGGSTASCFEFSLPGAGVDRIREFDGCDLFLTGLRRLLILGGNCVAEGRLDLFGLWIVGTAGGGDGDSTLELSVGFLTDALFGNFVRGSGAIFAMGRLMAGGGGGAVDSRFPIIGECFVFCL